MARQTTAQQYREDPEATVHHKTRRRSGGTTGVGQLRLTSMIDVVFQLLIYFVVTASFAIDEGILTTRLPQGSGPGNPADPPPRPLIVKVQTGGPEGYRLAIDGHPQAPQNFVQLNQLLQSLMRDPARGRNGVYPPDNPVIIRPDNFVRWTHAINAFNAAIAAGYSKITFGKSAS